MYAEISAALSSLKSLSELVKAANSISNYGEMILAVNMVQEKLSQALLANIESIEKSVKLQERVTELEAELAAFHEWSKVSEAYVLQAVGIERRHFAQIYRPAASTFQPRHWVCAKCFEERRLFILSASDRHNYECPNCHSKISPIERGGGLSPISGAYEGEWALKFRN